MFCLNGEEGLCRCIREERGKWQYAGFEFISGHINATGFTHLFLQLGQNVKTADTQKVHGHREINYIEPNGICQSAYLEVLDARGQQVLTKLYIWGQLAAPENQQHSHALESGLNIIRMPLGKLKNQVDFSCLSAIGVLHKAGISGPMTVDHLHWVGD